MTTFKGSIDQFLDHCSQLNADEVEAQIEAQHERDSCIKEISQTMDVSLEEATKMLEEFQLEIVQAELDKLVKDGLIEITKYENGEPIYGITDDGKEALDNFQEKAKKVKSKKKKDI